MPRIRYPQPRPARYHLPDDHFQRRPSARHDGLCTQTWLVYPFRAPETAEPQLWPMNAKLYGFEERYPSVDKPLNATDDTWNHPVWSEEREKRIGGQGDSFPAFMYTHDDLRHGLYTMYTDWVVTDPHTKEIELKECWACRRKGKGQICLIKGRRILPRDPTDPDSRYRILPPNGGGNGGGGNGGGGNGGGGNGGHGGGNGYSNDDGDDDDDGDGSRKRDGYEEKEEKPVLDKEEEDYEDEYSHRDPFGYLAELRNELDDRTQNAGPGSSTGPETAGNPALGRGIAAPRRRHYTVVDYGDYELVDLTGEIDDEDESGPSEPRSSESASNSGSKRKSEDSDPGEISTLTKRAKLAELVEFELDDSDFEILEHPAESTPSDDGDDGAGRFNFYAPNPDHNRLSVAPTGGPNETGHEHEEDDVDNEIDRVEDSYGDADDEEEK